MTELVGLPRPLQPWRAWLGWFEPQLAEALGDLVRRLSELAGPAPAATGRTAPEPDGLGDLRMRGPYERLLASEWLLADVAPEEFLRRAAASEHLFLAPLARATQVDRRVVAIFDCGPRQLGAPRLAHVAAWILLARRAADLGGALHWGVLQEPGRLRESGTPAHLLQLLSARSLVPDDDALRARWRDALQPGPDSVLPRPAATAELETWWIGAPGTPVVDRLDRMLAVRNTWAPGELEATLGTPAATRRANLPLPADALATALLRGQLSIAPARPVRPRTSPSARSDEQRLALTQPPLLSASGGHVAAPSLAGHAMLVFEVPPTARGKPVRRRRQALSPLRPAVAMSLQGFQARAVCLDQASVHFWQIDGFAARPRPAVEAFEASTASSRLLPMALLHDARGGQRVFVADRSGRLLRWSREGAQPDHVDDRVLGMTRLDQSTLGYAVEFGGGVWLRQVSAGGTPTPLVRRLCVLEERFAPVLLAAAGGKEVGGSLTAVAVRRRFSPLAVWRLFTWTGASTPDEHEIELQPSEHVAGLLGPRGKDGPALVVLSADRRSLHLADGQQRTTLHRSVDHRIMRCAVNADPARVALINDARELVVLDATTVPAAPLLVVPDAPEASR
jgi:hypothetical protein